LLAQDGDSALDDTAGIRLDRIQFAPGTGYTLPADGASLLIVSVESGALTIFSTAPLSIQRAAATDEIATQEMVAAGTQVSLAPGDAFVRPPDAALLLRNDGEQPAVALTAFVPTSVAGGEMHGAESAPLQSDDSGLVMALAIVVPPKCPEGYSMPQANPMATPGGGGGGGGSGASAIAVAEAPVCAGGDSAQSAAPVATPQP
jgi:hypothetical protein